MFLRTVLIQTIVCNKQQNPQETYRLPGWEWEIGPSLLAYLDVILFKLVS